MTDGRVSSPLNARLITVSVNGHPEFLFDAMQGQDGLSTLSEYTVRLLHRSADLYGDTLLGKALTLRIQTPDAQRYLNGLIADLRYDGPASEVDRYHAYTAVVMPWFWLADGNKDYRIYQNQSVPEIIKAVLTSYGDAFEFALVQTYAPRIYCVQYGESDFAFVSRLLEEEGIHYYFRHEEKRHVLVMSDDVLTHTTVPGYEQLRYFPEDKLALPQQDYATGIRSRERHRPGRYATSDYDFKKSRADLHMNSRIELPHEHSRNEVYEWQGNYDDQELGERYARQRMQELHHERNIRTLRSTARGVTTGALFTLTHCPRTQDNRQYLVLSTRYDLKENHYHSTRSPQAAGQNGRRCVFDLTIQDAQLAFRPCRLTVKPRIIGVQSAVVVGPREKEIWTDVHGRIKVQFPWDRYGNKDENSSCWIRVSSPWASMDYGAIQIPRIGDEVLVEFIDGDPDRPIIVGRVYNDSHMPPWNLPQNATQMGIYSRSTPDGDKTKANIIRFEDQKGQEEIFVHAQKDFHAGICNNANLHIGGYKHTQINKNETKLILGLSFVHANLSSTYTSSQDIVISAGQCSRIHGTASGEYISPSRYYVDYRNLSALNDTVVGGRKGALYLTSRIDTTIQSGANMQAYAEASVMLTGKEGVSLVSQSGFRIDAAGSLIQSSEDQVVMTAENGLILKCGGAHLILRSDGDIEMIGANIKINGTTICLN